ncbi:hypothetical protein ABKN59_004523 [Abortiporus biennis]
MSRQILLWRKVATADSDEACTTIYKYPLPPPYTPGPYDVQQACSSVPEKLTYVPSLASLCFKRLIEYPEQVHIVEDARLHYEPPKEPTDYDLLQELFPSFSYDAQDQLDLTQVDPRLWALVVQLIDSIPDAFRTYTLPLSDIHLPLLQQIPSTSHFSLVTVLELKRCPEIDNETILQLGGLHSLGALDVSATQLTSWGIRNLSKTLLISDDGALPRGPWNLRVLYLKDCLQIDDKVFEYLPHFPLLSVVDLRGTPCIPCSKTCLPFRASNKVELFSPTPLLRALSNLNKCLHATDDAKPSLFSHPEPFFLHVPRLHHKAGMPATRNTGVKSEPAFVTKSRPQFGDNFTVVPSRPKANAKTTLSRSVEIDTLGIAAEESSLESARRAVAAFYAPLPTTAHLRRHSSDMLSARDPQLYASDKKERLPDPWMLYRAPPPWATLFDSVHAAQETRQSARSTLKRARSSVDLAVHGSEARNTKKARDSIQAVMGLVGKRMNQADDSQKQPPGQQAFCQTKVAGSSNPFARNNGMSSMDPDLTRSHKPPRNVPMVHKTCLDPLLLASDPIQPVPTTKKSNKTKKSSRSSDERPPSSPPSCVEGPVSNSTFPIPPPTTKPLKPISTLPIPALPPSLLPKPPKKSLSSRRRSTEDGKQTTLSSHLIKRTASKESISVSPVGSETQTGQGGLKVNGTGTPSKTKKDQKVPDKKGAMFDVGAGKTSAGHGTVKGKTSKMAKRASAPVKFDWKGWSGAPNS